MLIKKRVNGFSLPLSPDQLTGVVTQLALTALYYVIVGSVLAGDQLVICLAVHIPLSCISLAAWLYVELVDPAEQGGIPCVCMEESQRSARYCGTCRKTVVGLDHHCVWLNTCIGKKNYAQFYCLVMTAFWSAIMNVLVGALLFTSWSTDEVRDRAKDAFGSMEAYHGLVIVLMALSGFNSMGLGSLYGFHTFLVFVARKGTYDWLVDRRNTSSHGGNHAHNANAVPEETKQQADIEARRELERQEWLQQRMKKKQAQAQTQAQTQAPEVEMTPRATAVLDTAQDHAV